MLKLLFTVIDGDEEKDEEQEGSEGGKALLLLFEVKLDLGKCLTSSSASSSSPSVFVGNRCLYFCFGSIIHQRIVTTALLLLLLLSLLLLLVVEEEGPISMIKSLRLSSS